MTNTKFLAVVVATLLAFAPAFAESICGDSVVNDGLLGEITYINLSTDTQTVRFTSGSTDIDVSLDGFGEGNLVVFGHTFSISAIDTGSATTPLAIDSNSDGFLDAVIDVQTIVPLTYGMEVCDGTTTLPGLACSDTCELFTPEVEIVVKDWFPQNASYVFECRTPGYAPESYDWEFGDGHKLYDMPVFDNYHTYEENGAYTVSCSVDVNGQTMTGTLDIDVATYDPELNINLAPWYPKGGHHVFTCDAENWDPTSYDWEFGDGEKLYDRLENDQYHVYEANGNYTLICAAKEGAETYVVTQTIVEVTGCRDLNLEITSIIQDSEMTTVEGTLADINDENADLGLYTVEVGNTEAGILLNQWSATFPNSDADIIATVDDWCGHDITATFEEDNESDEQLSDEEMVFTTTANEQLASGSGSRGDCAWGYTRENDRCVKNEATTPIANTPEPSNDNTVMEPEQTPETLVLNAPEEEDNNFLTGAVIGGGFASTAWLWILLGILAALAIWAAAEHK